MATITFPVPFPTSVDTTGVGQPITATSTLVEFQWASGYIERYGGQFTVANGQLSGFATSLDLVYQGQTFMSARGAFIPASTIYAGTEVLLDTLFMGSDNITGSNGGDVLFGMDGNDTIIALDGNDTVFGDDGADDVNGNVGEDSVMGDGGADWVRGGKGNDTISGGSGDDPHVNGNIGNDVVHGDAGNDTIYGGQDQDTLYGDSGNDVLSGDVGNDILYGGIGADRFVLRAGSGLDWVGDFKASEGDRIQLAPGTAYTVVSISGQVVIDLGGGDQLGLAGVTTGFTTDWIVFA